MSPEPTRLTVVSPYGPDIASYRERVDVWMRRLDVPADPTWYFGRSGTAASFGPLALGRSFRTEAGLRRLRRASIRSLLLHREASPFSTGKLEADLLAAADTSAYDVDDALHGDWGRENLVRRVFSKAGKAAACVEAASITVVGNDILASWAATLSSDVRVIPTCVDPNEHDDRTDYELHDPPRLLWIGSPTTIPHLELVQEPLLRLNRELGAELIVIGGTLGSPQLDQIATVVPWSRSAQRSWLSQCDVGIMPLPDGPLERGKCGYKLLQYAAAGLPAVASPVGVNRTIIERLGLPLVETDDDWYDALLGLLRQPSSQRKAGADRARSAVVEHYSFDAWAPAWRTLMADLGVRL